MINSNSRLSKVPSSLSLDELLRQVRVGTYPWRTESRRMSWSISTGICTRHVKCFFLLFIFFGYFCCLTGNPTEYRELQRTCSIDARNVYWYLVQCDMYFCCGRDCIFYHYRLRHSVFQYFGIFRIFRILCYHFDHNSLALLHPLPCSTPLFVDGCV